MRRELFALLALSLLAGAALDQSYVQSVSRNGASTVEKAMEISVFSNQLAEGGLERMAAFCEETASLDCSVDVAEKRITIREGFTSGGYYTYSSEYGIPFITHTMTVSKLPTDRFSSALEKLLAQSGAVEYSGAEGSGRVIDLTDGEGNAEAVAALRMLKANITYTVVMPSQVSEARAGAVEGQVSGNSATFSVLDVMEESEPIVVRSQEFNYGYIIAIAGIVALAALALSFARTKPGRRKR